ncbi:MAG: 16S rRNA (guanine(527)-N(7))-methyltransferase RsmG [Bacilli bacterium]|nr:16S rRNA (guanine(527)-N(7))-methyltransferase RsmG [Bacilli bacterium]
MKIDKFIEELKKINIEVKNEKLELLAKYCTFLKEYNEHTNLTAIKDDEGIYLKHFYDSLLVTKYYDFSKVDNMLDIGSGAGFPGVVLKIFYPNINVTLMDSNNKKTTFLEKLIEHLKLENINVVHDRAENYAKNNRQKYDVTIARAVSELRIISELALPLTKVKGYFIALKGNYEEEMDNALKTFNKLSSKVEYIKEDNLPIENSRRSFIFIKVLDNIDNKYPRSYEQIIKKPLK